MPRIDSEFLVRSLQQLVQINSINPRLSEGAPGEEEISRYIAHSLSKMNIPAEVEEIAPGRLNVTAAIQGKGDGKSLIINAHTDTVGVQGMDNPFSGHIENGRLYGRGSMDMKGSIAAMLTMAKHLTENDSDLVGDVILSFVADEEYGSIGTEHFLKDYTGDAAIVTEPTSLNICSAHKGFTLFEITTTGKAAHGGRPDLGVDANAMIGRLLAKIEQLSARLSQQESHPLLGRPSMHIPVINGGTEPFTYADSCTIMLERRTLPGEQSGHIQEELQSIIRELKQEDADFRASLKCIVARDAFEARPGQKITTLLEQSVQQITSRTPSHIGHHWWEDSGLFDRAGIDTIVIGPKGEGLHAAEEWVDIESVVQLSEILADTATSFCSS